MVLSACYQNNKKNAGNFGCLALVPFKKGLSYKTPLLRTCSMKLTLKLVTVSPLTDTLIVLFFFLTLCS